MVVVVIVVVVVVVVIANKIQYFCQDEILQEKNWSWKVQGKNFDIIIIIIIIIRILLPLCFNY